MANYFTSMQTEEPNKFTEGLIEFWEQQQLKISQDKMNDFARQSQEKVNQYNKLKRELETTQKEQITDLYASFPTRLGRYVKIKLLRHTLNHFYK